MLCKTPRAGLDRRYTNLITIVIIIIIVKCERKRQTRPKKTESEALFLPWVQEAFLVSSVFVSEAPYRTQEKPSGTLVTWDQALFSFRFENYIPENVREPLKLDLISG